ncbi:MAG TPA: FAD-dependent oxidoreductase [Pirellulales bacterium]|nr:FAD-dependent oxidoreductase [Pirellulales bacterium]
MSPRALVWALIGLGCFAPSGWAQNAVIRKTDVCVYGATPAGIAAAIAAARAGARVILIEPTKWIGGMVTGGLTSTDTGLQATIGGIAREFFERAAARYEGKNLWFAEPHANAEAFEAMLKEAGVTVRRDLRLERVAMQGERIAALSTDAGAIYLARVFIDASYEGDLLMQAGVDSIVGRESREKYDEPLAGFFPMPIRPRTVEVMESVCSCLGGTGPHYIHGTPCKIAARDGQGKLLFGIGENHAAPGSADGLTQAYNFRLVVTRRPDLRMPFTKPDGYDPARYALLLKLIEAYPGVRFGRLVHLGKVAEDKFDLNAQGLFSTDYPGANTAYPDASWDERKKIYDDHQRFIQGFLWFLASDERVPKRLRDEVAEWGLCRDEFMDNDHWPYALYVREGRRMIGEYVMVQKDCQREVTKPDSVGMGSFVIDSHIVERIVDDEGNVSDEGSFIDAPCKPYQIPYRSLTPRREQCENLLVPVCLSASHVACCTLRMEPVYMALGHAAGVAAKLAIDTDTAVQSIDVTALQGKLREQKAVLELKK